MNIVPPGLGILTYTSTQHFNAGERAFHAGLSYLAPPARCGALIATAVVGLITIRGASSAACRPSGTRNCNYT